MNNLLIVLKNSYSFIILCIVSYIFFRIITRIKFKNKINIQSEISLILFMSYLLVLFSVVTYPINEYNKNNFNLFEEIKRYKIGSSLFMYNIVGNIIMFIPFGMFVNNYFHMRKITLIIITIIYSLLIEIIQLIVGRVFDIDDIVLNLIGSIIGFYVVNSIK